MKHINLKNIIKFMFIIFIIFVLLFIGLLILLVLSLFGVIQEYTYLNINDKNRKEISSLIIQQKDKMLSMSNDLNIDNCIKDVKRIEVIFLFPDGEDYTIYCNNGKYNFSLDNSNYDLPNYLGKHGKLGYRKK